MAGGCGRDLWKGKKRRAKRRRELGKRGKNRREKAKGKRELEQETINFLKSTDVLINFAVTVTLQSKTKAISNI